jgi:hypothetical protein
MMLVLKTTENRSMAKTARALALALALALVPACGGGGGDSDPLPPTPSSEIALVVLSNNTLITYAARAPGVPLYSLPVTGLGAETLVGFDYRPSNGEILAVSNASKLYVINPNTGAATARGGTFAVLPMEPSSASTSTRRSTASAS